MSDRQTEQERDAAVIDPAAMIREMASMMIVYPHYHDTYNRAIRTIDRLTAERDQAREQLAKLRAACDGTPWLLETARERDGSSWDYPWPEVYDDAAARIRAALGIESEAGE